MISALSAALGLLLWLKKVLLIHCVVSILKSILFAQSHPNSHLCRPKLITMSTETIMLLLYSENKGEIALHVEVVLITDSKLL